MVKQDIAKVLGHMDYQVLTYLSIYIDFIIFVGHEKS